LGQSEGPGASFIWKVGAVWRPGPINAGWLHMVQAASVPVGAHCTRGVSIEAWAKLLIFTRLTKRPEPESPGPRA
jgi:hypothetical protein